MNRYIVKIRKRLPRGRQEEKFPYAHGILLILTLAVIFIVPVFPGIYSSPLYPGILSGIFISAVLSVHKNERITILLAVFLTTFIWISIFTHAETILRVLRLIQFVFFNYIILSLIAQISGKSRVTLEVIIDSVVGYLLLGLAFSLLVTTISSWMPDSYNVLFVDSDKNSGTKDIKDNIYYTFMTFTTTGYGDIVPKHPLSKSLAVLISVSGQLYIAIIIALLIGKYASSNQDSN